MPPIPVEMCLAGTDVTDPRVRPGGEWVSAIVAVAHPDGASVSLRMWRVADGVESVLLTDPVPATGRGMSGGVHTWHPSGESVVVALRTGGIVRIEIENNQATHILATPCDPARTWTTPAVSPDGTSACAVADWREVCSWRLDGNETGEVETVYTGRDFIIDCEWWKNRIVAVAWDRPEMPWTRSELVGVSVADVRVPQQPRATRDGSVAGYIDDLDGRGFRIMGISKGDVWRLPPDEGEHATPTWGPGQRSFAFSPDGRRVAFTRNIDGFGSLWVTTINDPSGRATRIGLGVHGCVSWEGDTLAALRSGARTPPQVVAYDVSDHALATDLSARTIVFDTADSRWKSNHDDALVEPTILRTSVPGGFTLVSRLYSSPHPHGGLIVWVHGGPQDQWQVTWRPRVSYWVSRGWTVCVPDHRGSSGHGGDFIAALDGDWGGADAEDVVAVAQQLWNTAEFEPRRTILMGWSAGGLAALNAARLAHNSAETVAGVVATYPVVDLDEMFDCHDPFESHGMPRLIGERGTPSVVQRSPHMNAHELCDTPILLFHGDMDTSVPLVHSQRLVDAVRVAGGRDIELIVMEGEGHGFRNPLNVRREYLETERFLERTCR